MIEIYVDRVYPDLDRNAELWDAAKALVYLWAEGYPIRIQIGDIWRPLDRKAWYVHDFRNALSKGMRFGVVLDLDQVLAELHDLQASLDASDE